MSAITAKASRKMKKYAVLTREPRCFLGSFDFSWEQRKLSEIADKITEKNSGLQYVETFTNSAEFGIISQRDFFDHDIAKLSSLDGYYIVKNEDFVYNPRISTSAPVGPINRNKLGRTGVMSPLYTVFRPHDVDTTYLEHFFKCAYWHSFMNFNGDSGARSDRFSIKNDVFFQMPIPLPHIDEQRKIGELLTCLDHLITLHQRKCVFLFGLFQASISMIFTASTFSWEQRKVSDLAEKTYGGGTPTTSNEAYWNGDIPWIQSSDVVDGKLLGVEPRKWITQDGLNNSAAQLIPGNSIAIITRVGVGKLAFMPYSYATSQDFLSLSKLNAEPLFTVYACYKKLQSELNAVQGTSIKGITKDELLAKNIMVPRYAEQQQIGAFFKQLDHLITLHQRECISFTVRAGGLILTANKKRTTSSWEQRKAKELFVSTADKGYPELPVLSATQDRGMIRRDENSINIFHDKKNEAGYKRVLPGQFVIHLRSFQGGFAHSAIEGITSPAYTVFGFSEPEKHDSEYWKYVFTSKSFIQRLETVTYGIRDGRSISYEEFLTLGFVYPSKAEQTAIARYLDKLSDLITLHQRKPFLMKWRTSDANRNQTNRLVL